VAAHEPSLFDDGPVQGKRAEYEAITKKMTRLEQ
jgi:hypothetical protein